MARKQEKYTVKKFNKISIGLSSPEAILEISKGEVLKPETIKRWFILRAYFWSCKGL
jgi:DNA-directed RNA polymerase subunit beta'